MNSALVCCMEDGALEWIQSPTMPTVPEDEEVEDVGNSPEARPSRENQPPQQDDEGLVSNAEEIKLDDGTDEESPTTLSAYETMMGSLKRDPGWPEQVVVVVGFVLQSGPSEKGKQNMWCESFPNDPLS